MNILLLAPPSNSSEQMYPLALGSLSSVLKREGHHVSGADLSFTSMEECKEMIKEKRIGIVGIPVSYQNYEDAMIGIRAIKTDFSIPVTVFGSYATILKESLFHDKGCNADYCIIGDPETTFSRIVSALAKKQDVQNIGGLIWKDNGKINVNSERKYSDSKH